MMKKLLLMLSFFLIASYSWAQDRTVSGTVTDEEGPLPGVNVIVKGTTTGTTTDLDGNYKLSIPSDAEALVFTYIGYEKTEIIIGTRSVIDVTLQPDVQQLGEVVVTALGIERDQKSLGYSVQEVSGESLSEAKEQNVINSLSGKVAGVQVRSSNTMGGSANILIRGTNTLAGNNQPLFVVDGVPIDNSSYNSANQEAGGGGYDYGNPAADLNPEDIESMSVLKGGSAAALYGSRALNGVILITTKKGSKGKGVGVSVNSSVTFSQINQNTMPQHQKEYGAGYGNYWTYADLDGDGNDEQIVNTADDASWGPKFDPNLEVVHWDALFPGEDNYGETRPWVAGEAGIEEFFETGVSMRNNVSINGGTEKATYRLSYTNEDTKGIAPNSSMKSNTVALNASLEATDKLKISTSVNYVGNEVIGRQGTGYAGTNVMQSFGQWFQSNLDFNRLKNYKDEAGNQRAWNLAGASNPRGYYFNNPYWVVNENFQSDGRDRVFGNVFLEYQLFDGVKLNGRSTIDFYNFGQEERVNVGSAITDVPSYVRREYTFMERNDDFFVTIDKYLNDNFSISGLIGVNRRTTTNSSLQLGTFRGMVNKDVFAISNTISPEVNYTDDFSEKAQRSAYGNVSFGFNDMVFLDLTARNDWSSTLPEGANSYFYPSVSTSFIFTELEGLRNSDILSFGKLRANWSRVGNDTDPYRTRNYFEAENSFGSSPVYRYGTTLNNPALKSETKEGIEFGTELLFFNRRIGLNASVYKDNTYDQIIPVKTSTSTGYNFQYINAGNFENKGIEIALNATPVDGDFRWDMNVNWAKNVNTVVELAEGIDNYTITSFFFASINATEGEPFGTIRGTNFQYKDGEKVINSDGYYAIDDSIQTIGNATPDWNLGFSNTFSYKGFSLRTLFDMQMGGDIFSLNTAFGRATGLYEETAGLNAKGNPKRDPVAEGGGILLEGVQEDGSENTVYAPAGTWGQAWQYGSNNPAANYVFDATYIKLRELAFGYKFPQSFLGDLPIKNLEFNVVGRNLAILHSNVKHFDPEVTRSSGNAQGYESGTYPTPRTYGFNVKFNF